MSQIFWTENRTNYSDTEQVNEGGSLCKFVYAVCGGTQYCTCVCDLLLLTKSNRLKKNKKTVHWLLLIKLVLQIVMGSQIFY